jgi:hypothetical protein
MISPQLVDNFLTRRLWPVPAALGDDGEFHPLELWQFDDDGAPASPDFRQPGATSLMIATGYGLIALALRATHPSGCFGALMLGSVCLVVGPLPKCPIINAPNGDKFYLIGVPFDLTVDSSIDCLGPLTLEGVDVIGKGGFVTAPPAQTKSGHYHWNTPGCGLPAPPAPDWLIALLTMTKSEWEGLINEP